MYHFAKHFDFFNGNVPVVSGARLAKYKVVRSEELSKRAGAHAAKF